MKPPKERAEYGMMRWIAETLEMKKSCVMETLSQARAVQRYMKKMKRKGQVEVRDGKILIWRMK